MKTAFLLPQLFPASPLRPLEWISEAPIRQEVTLPRNGGSAPGDLYLPRAQGRHGALILVLGVNPLERREPIVVSLAEGLARLGLVVLLPESPELSAGLLTAQEPEALVAAFRYLQAQPMVDPSRVGFAGFCVGASLVALAASDPRIAEEVALLHLFGPYYDAHDFLRAVITERQSLDGVETPWAPSALTRQAVGTHLLEAVADPEDLALLKEVYAWGENAAILPLRSSTGRAVAELLSQPSPDRYEALLAQLPPSAHQRLLTLSPSEHLDSLKAPVFLIHERSDTYVPVAESRRFRDALGRGRLTSYVEFQLFEHVVPTLSSDLLRFPLEVFRLYRHLLHTFSSLLLT